MSETTDVVKQVLERIDVLAAKLGIAAEHIWAFTVKSKAVEARRDMAKAIALLIIPLMFWGWSIHVYRMPIPHDVRSEFTTGICRTMTSGTFCTQNAEPTTKQGDISALGAVLIVSGVVLFFVGLIVAVSGVNNLVDAIADLHTTEADAFREILYDLKD